MLKTTVSVMMTAMLWGCSAQSGAETAAPATASDVPVLTGDNVWAVDKDKSAVTFDAYYNGEFTGEFTRFDAAIRLNPAAPQTGEIHAVVDLSSVKTKDTDVANNLPMAAWFNTKAFPVATFKSDTITAAGDDAFSAAGELTLKGISKPVVLNFTLNVTGDTATAEGTIAMNRTDFNVGTGSDFKDESWVKFPVRANMTITANR